MEKQEVFVGDAPQDNGLGEYFVLKGKEGCYGIHRK